MTSRPAHWILLMLFAHLIPGVALAGALPERAEGAVIVNAVPLTAAQLQAIERAQGVRTPPGRYWYDTRSGAWGYERGPTMGFVYPGLRLGGPLRADASGGGTGVFVNGRELHVLDVMSLARFVPVMRGRWWVTADGNYGPEGGPRWGNLWVLARQSSAGGPWSGGASSDGKSYLGFSGGCGYFQGSNPVGGATVYAPPGC